MTEPEFQLFYWPVLQGRGEFVRLAFEATETPYADVARLPEEEGGGFETIRALMEGRIEGVPPYAPPVLKHGELVIAQTANILLYLAPKLGLAPASEADRFRANQHQLTIMDAVAEAHDTHHPISKALYYEEQEEAALAAAKTFVSERLPRFLGHFDMVMHRAGAGWLVGDAMTYVDLSLFQLIEGLKAAFPRATAARLDELSSLVALCDRVRSVAGVAAYLASDRRLPFNEHGIFRPYPELDVVE